MFFLRCLFAAPQDRPDPGNQFQDAEGFADIVVRTAVEGLDDIIFTGFGSDHDDRQFLVAGMVAQFFQDIRTAFAGKHDIQQDQGRGLFFHGGPEGTPVGKSLHFEMLSFEGISHQFTNIFIIFHTVNECHFCTAPFKNG